MPYPKNSFCYPYNNGRIEGINNKIKVLNRIAYGYSDFTRYKNRTLLYFKFKPAKKFHKITISSKGASIPGAYITSLQANYKYKV